jgi:hypothetical protein
MAIKKLEVALPATEAMRARITDCLMKAQLATTKSPVGNITVHGVDKSYLQTWLSTELGMTFEDKGLVSCETWQDNAHVIISSQGTHSLIQILSY